MEDADSAASLQAAMDVPVTASLGPMGPLLQQLHSLGSLPKGVSEEEIQLFKEDLGGLCISLKDVSEAEDASSTANWWMKEVRELCYDTQDYFDEVVAHSGAGAGVRRKARLSTIFRVRKKLEWRPQIGKRAQGRLEKISTSSFPKRKNLKRRPQIAISFSELMDRVEALDDVSERFKLGPKAIKPDFAQASDSHLTPKLSLQLPVPISVHADTGGRSIVGVEEPMKKLVDLLAFDDDNQKQLKVVPIFGFAGVGKTTLARTIYDRFGGKFQCRAFLRLSRTPDMRMLLNGILSQIKAPRSYAFSDAQDLIDNIREHLQGKRYFIIIDDLWTTSVWNIISRAFPDGDCCSRIVTTTQIKDVAMACCNYHLTYMLEMRALNDDQSRKLFFNIIFGSEDGCPPDFREVAFGIISKCGGLPLATVNIASMLASEPNLIMEKWKHIQDSLPSTLRTNYTPLGIKELFCDRVIGSGSSLFAREPKLDQWKHIHEFSPSTSEGMKDVLNLICNSLPPRLKTCLLYFSMYPEGYVIKKDELVKQWVAESFLIAVERRDAEEMAKCYFDELVRRGMVQAVDTNYDGEVLSCTIHHMVLDLIRYKSMEENFVINVDRFQSTLALPDKVRRFSVQFGGAKGARIPEGIILSQVRSLTFCGFVQLVPSIVEYGLLRVLILHIWADQEKIFDLGRIGELFRLRYLKIECNMTIKLPAKIGGLQYLETLEIDARLPDVPSDIVHLENLLHIRLPSEANLPHGVGHMTSLRTLGYFDLGSSSEDNVLDIGKLTNIQDLHLTCSTVQLAYNPENNMKCLGLILRELSSLKCLALIPAAGSSSVNTLQGDAGASSMSISCDGLSSVSPAPVLLERLELTRMCIFPSLPKWFGELSKLCILKIAVRRLSREDIDILKGLPALTTLSLYIQTVPADRLVIEGKEGFPVLTYFKFMCTAPCLSFVEGAMPNVRKLKLGFNANRMKRHSLADAGFKCLTGLREISLKLGGATTDESDRRAAEFELEAALSHHPKTLISRVQCVGVIFDEEDKITVMKGQEQLTPGMQREIKESKMEHPSEDVNEEIDSGISTKTESSSHLQNPVTEHETVARAMEGGKVSASTGAMDSVLMADPATVLEIGMKAVPGEDVNEEIDSGICTKSESSSHMQNPVAEHKTVVVEMEDAMVSVSTGAMNSILSKLATVLWKRRYPKIIGKRERIMSLKVELDAMNDLLNQLADMPGLSMEVKGLRNQMREMTYDVEDCIDDLMLKFDKDIDDATMLKWDMLEEFVCQIQDLTGRVCKADLPSMVHTTEVQTLRSSYKATGSELHTLYNKATGPVGIDGPRDELVKRMNGGEQQLQVACILGSRGLGKTTLATEVYNHVKGQFHHRVFIQVPQKMDITRLHKVILLELRRRQIYLDNGKSLDNMDEASLIDQVRRYLRDKRYLVVIDGVWSVQTWEVIKSALPDDERASRILVTTNDMGIAKSCEEHSFGFIYPMKPLNARDCLSLFGGILFGYERSFPTELKNVAEKIVAACGGIPMAIIIMAGILGSKPAEAEREMVEIRMEAVAGDGDLSKEMIRKMFHMSYSGLPRDIKSCLLYLSTFPENRLIRKDHLIWRWIAEGFVPERSGESSWKTGERYFLELIVRNLIEPVYEDEKHDYYEVPVGCKVHDLILEFITSVSNEENFVTRIAELATHVQHDVIRRLGTSYMNQEEEDHILRLISTGHLPKLRSVTILGRDQRVASPLLPWGPLLLGSRFLRVLDLEDVRSLQNKHLEGTIEGLVLLRYLGLTGTAISQLPEGIGKVEQLETLDLRRNDDLRTLPASIASLRKLVHLLVDPEVELPGEMSKMQELEEVSTISSSSLNLVAELLVKSNSLRMLDVNFGTGTCSRESIMSFLRVVRNSNLQSLSLCCDDDVVGILLDSWEVLPRHLRRFKLEICIRRVVPPQMASLVSVTHLDISIDELKVGDVRVLRDLPNLVLLKLTVGIITTRCVISGEKAFQCLKVFTLRTGAMGLQFTPGAMPQLQRLRLNFSARKTLSIYGGFDFGIQHLSCLARLHATIDCSYATVSKVEAAEAAIRRQVSNFPIKPAIEFSKSEDEMRKEEDDALPGKDDAGEQVTMKTSLKQKVKMMLSSRGRARSNSSRP